MTRLSRPASAALLLPLLLAACVTLRQRDERARGEGNTVMVDEPAIAVEGPASTAEVEEPSLADDLASGAARLVANDGRTPVAVQNWASPWVGGLCRRGTLSGAPSLLDDAGVFGAVDPYAAVQSWVAIGISFSPDGVMPMAWYSPCGGPWAADAGVRRTGRLAPEVSGRDTSLLFTTRRASLGPSGAARVLGAVTQWLLPASEGSTNGADDGQPRTARPRGAPASGAPAAAPGATPAATPAPASTPAAVAPAAATPAAPVSAAPNGEASRRAKGRDEKRGGSSDGWRSTP